MEDVAIDPRFHIDTDIGTVEVGINFLMSLQGHAFCAIHCATSAIESWERYIIAFARAAIDYQIPYAIITDGVRAKVFDILGKSSSTLPVGEPFPCQEALLLMNHFRQLPFPEGKREKERRIIYAFEGLGDVLNCL